MSHKYNYCVFCDEEEEAKAAAREAGGDRFAVEYHTIEDCVWGDEDEGYIAEECAKDYYDNRDGWECWHNDNWKMFFVVYDENKNKLFSRYVSAEMEPTFHAAWMNEVKF